MGPPSPSAPIPEFSGPIQNITAAVGREAVLTCTVTELGQYKVSPHLITFVAEQLSHEVKLVSRGFRTAILAHLKREVLKCKLALNFIASQKFLSII